MNIKSIVEYLKKFDHAGGRKGSEYAQWIDGDDVLGFLDASSRSDLIPVFISSEGYFLYSVFVPNGNVDAESLKTLTGWSLNLEERALTFSLVGWKNDYRIEVQQPYANEQQRLFLNAEPLYFHRSFSRRHDDASSNFEFSQRLIHASEAHWVNRQEAFCELNEQGDYIDLFKRLKVGEIELVVASRKKLQLYGLLTEQTLLRVFEVIRNKDGFSDSVEKSRSRATLKAEGISIERLTIQWKSGETTAQLRGGQVVANSMTKDEAVKLLSGEGEEKKYAEFIAHDFKNGVVKEISCAPSALANYFVKSDLPFETTPAFFRPEVLSRYKSDPAKYEVHQRHIRCIGGWYLRTYDINSDGQVHTYLCYLRDLPYSEQLYWKSFNEAPKGTISERAFQTDFAGKWWDGRDPLEELKTTLRSFPNVDLGERTVQIYRPGTDDFDLKLRELSYVTSNSVGEWKAQTINLAALCIDSLSKSGLKEVAASRGVKDAELGSIMLLEESLRATGLAEQVVLEICGPLHATWGIRSREGIAHMGNIPKDLKYNERFEALVDDMAKGMKLLSEQISKGIFMIAKAK